MVCSVSEDNGDGSGQRLPGRNGARAYVRARPRDSHVVFPRKSGMPGSVGVGMFAVSLRLDIVNLGLCHQHIRHCYCTAQLLLLASEPFCALYSAATRPSRLAVDAVGYRCIIPCAPHLHESPVVLDVCDSDTHVIIHTIPALRTRGGCHTRQGMSLSQQFHPAPTSHRLYVRSLQPCCNLPISQYRMTPGSIGTMPRCEPRTEETERHVSHEYFAPHVALMSVVIASLDFSVSIVSDAFAGKVSEMVRIHAFDMRFKSSLDDHATSSDDLCRAVRRICGRTARTLPQDQDCSGDYQCRSEVVARFIPHVSDQSYVLVGTVNTSFALTDSDTA